MYIQLPNNNLQTQHFTTNHNPSKRSPPAPSRRRLRWFPFELPLKPNSRPAGSQFECSTGMDPFLVGSFSPTNPFEKYVQVIMGILSFPQIF